jgi:hypothetical protein
MVGLNGLEPSTPRLSSVCSNQLSYRPIYYKKLHVKKSLKTEYDEQMDFAKFYVSLSP